MWTECLLQQSHLRSNGAILFPHLHYFSFPTFNLLQVVIKKDLTFLSSTRKNKTVLWKQSKETFADVTNPNPSHLAIDYLLANHASEIYPIRSGGTNFKSSQSAVVTFQLLGWLFQGSLCLTTSALQSLQTLNYLLLEVLGTTNCGLFCRSHMLWVQCLLPPLPGPSLNKLSASGMGVVVSSFHICCYP